MTVKLEPQPTEIPAAKPKHVVDTAQDEKARQGIVKSVTDVQRAFAWPVYRHPLMKRIAANRTTLHLPRSYLARDGEDTKIIYPGSDINMVVYNHYANDIHHEECAKWINFVHADAVLNKRHEFLGPDAKVAGYVIDGSGHTHIRWYDGFLQDQWVGKRKWRVETERDASGKWIAKDPEYE